MDDENASAKIDLEIWWGPNRGCPMEAQGEVQGRRFYARGREQDQGRQRG